MGALEARIPVFRRPRRTPADKPRWLARACEAPWATGLL